MNLKLPIAVLLLLIISVLLSGCSMYPPYSVWEQEYYGKAELAKATSTRKIAIEEAKAKEESAESLARAEVIRAMGVAEANKIISESLKDNNEYLHYLWIQALEESMGSLIYVPTEAQLPLLEATRNGK